MILKITSLDALKFGLASVSLAVLLTVFSSAHAQEGTSDGSPGGTPGCSSEGSEGMPDTESVYSTNVAKALKKGKNSLEHISSLLALGMHYNRNGKFAQASKTLRNALAIVDAGALKPTPPSARRPEKVIETNHGDGTVSAQVVRVPMPYEETLQELLPQLISAELEANELNIVEPHIRRLIALQGPNQVADKLALMSAYSSYSQLMRKRQRNKEADEYQRKADQINASFKPL
jgi:hypothetical protein